MPIQNHWAFADFAAGAAAITASLPERRQASSAKLAKSLGPALAIRVQ